MRERCLSIQHVMWNPLEFCSPISSNVVVCSDYTFSLKSIDDNNHCQVMQ